MIYKSVTDVIKLGIKHIGSPAVSFSNNLDLGGECMDENTQD